MKKFLTILLTTLMVFTLAGCNNNSGNGGNTPDPEPTDDGVTNVAVLIPFRGDQSYYDTVAFAADELDAADNNIKVDVFECDPNGTKEESNWMNWFDNVCEEGKYDLVVCGNGNYEPFLFAACEKYPDQLFYNFDSSAIPASGVPANCYAVDWALDDLGYQVGSLSAAITKSGVVGVVVGDDTPDMNQFIGGYCQILTEKGVKYLISYCGAKWMDPALGKELADSMIAKGADVIWEVAGGTGNGVVEACSAHENVWEIGVDRDRYAEFVESKPEWANTILTSALKNTNVAFKAVCEMVANGTYNEKLGKLETWGIAWNGVGLAENDFYMANTTEEVRAQIAADLARVSSGEVEVVDTKLMDDATYASEWPTIRDAGRIE